MVFSNPLIFISTGVISVHAYTFIDVIFSCGTSVDGGLGVESFKFTTNRSIKFVLLLKLCRHTTGLFSVFQKGIIILHNQSKPVKTSQNQSKPVETSQNQSKPVTSRQTESLFGKRSQWTHPNRDALN